MCVCIYVQLVTHRRHAIGARSKGDRVFSFSSLKCQRHSRKTMIKSSFRADNKLFPCVIFLFELPRACAPFARIQCLGHAIDWFTSDNENFFQCFLKLTEKVMAGQKYGENVRDASSIRSLDFGWVVDRSETRLLSYAIVPGRLNSTMKQCVLDMRWFSTFGAAARTTSSTTREKFACAQTVLFICAYCFFLAYMILS